MDVSLKRGRLFYEVTVDWYTYEEFKNGDLYFKYSSIGMSFADSIAFDLKGLGSGCKGGYCLYWNYEYSDYRNKLWFVPSRDWEVLTMADPTLDMDKVGLVKYGTETSQDLKFTYDDEKFRITMEFLL